MGMAASQARLLSITARLTNNENSGQDISYSKQRLADQTEQLTNEYNEALSTTKLTVLTGFNGAIANYEDISYNLMTGLQMSETNKQYAITDTKGRILLTENVADAFRQSHGNFNQFLTILGYSQADINVKMNYTNLDNRTDEQAAAEKKIHDAWDKYYESIGDDIDYTAPHNFGYGWTTTNDGYGYAGYKRVETDASGNVVYNKKTLLDEEGNPELDENGNQITIDDIENPRYIQDGSGNYIYDPINYEGTTQESRELYDYAMALTEAYLSPRYNISGLKSANDSANNSAIKYYRNIFNKIMSSGFFTYTDTAAKANDNYIYSENTKGTNKIAKNPLKDNFTFESALKNGTLRIEYYSTADKTFKSTSISDDNCIQEVKDERKIAEAETKYNQDMADIERKDKRLDLELNKLDTEHRALQTEYDSVKSVVDKNVETTFKIFS